MQHALTWPGRDRFVNKSHRNALQRPTTARVTTRCGAFRTGAPLSCNGQNSRNTKTITHARIKDTIVKMSIQWSFGILSCAKWLRLQPVRVQTVSPHQTTLIQAVGRAHHTGQQTNCCAYNECTEI
jgi:hypothetical protein